MVKKLLKHEATYYARTLIIFEIVLFALAIFARILLFFETDSIIYYLIQGSSYVLFGLSAIACIFMATVISVFRFYKNLFTSEGYLTFALPVSTNQHLFAKLLSAFTYSVITYASIFVATAISISGDILNETFKAAAYVFKTVYEHLNNAHITLYIIEFAVILLLSIIANYVIFYSCIAIGQTAKKNRILLAVGVYFIYNAVSEIFSTVLMIAFTILENHINFEAIGRFIEKHPYATVHIALLALLIWLIIIIAAFYIVTYRIISRKLNLE